MGDMHFTLQELMDAYKEYRLIHYNPLDTNEYRNQFNILSRRAFNPKELALVKDQSFSSLLSEFVNKKYKKDADFYKDIEMSRQLFSKIINNPDYQPTRETVMKCCIGLRLGERDAQLLMTAAGYSFSSALDLDLIIKMCIAKRCYEKMKIDQLLVKNNVKPLFAIE